MRFGLLHENLVMDFTGKVSNSTRSLFFSGLQWFSTFWSSCLLFNGCSGGHCSPLKALIWMQLKRCQIYFIQSSSKVYQKGQKITFFSGKMTSGYPEVAFLTGMWRTLVEVIVAPQKKQALQTFPVACSA